MFFNRSKIFRVFCLAVMGWLMAGGGFGEMNRVHAQMGKSALDRFDVVNVGLGMSNRGLPIFIGLEQSLDDHISAGLLASYRSYREGGASGTWQHQFVGIGAQGHYHFTEIVPPPFDFFAGLTLAWYTHNFRWVGGAVEPFSYTGNVVGGLQLAAHLGGRYTYKDWTFFTQLTGGSLLSGYTFGLSIPL
jgi:hypothetical protein